MTDRGERSEQDRRGAKAPVVVVGELLCDLLPPAPGITLAEAPHLIPCPGGAPANVAVQIARLGGAVQLVTAIGDDPLGARVLERLAADGVDVSNVIRKQGLRTGLTLIEVTDEGQRSFHPWRENAADQAMREDEIPTRDIHAAAAVHTGTVTLRTVAGRRATRAATDTATEADVAVSLDVNLRHRMFPSVAMLARLARGAVRRADIVKATVEELSTLYGAGATQDPESAARTLLRKGPALAMVTMDADGALLATRKHNVHVAAPPVQLVDATGAGDAFCGAALCWLQQSMGHVRRAKLDALDEADLMRLGTAACAAGAAAVTKMGATEGMLRASVREGDEGPNR